MKIQGKIPHGKKQRLYKKIFMVAIVLVILAVYVVLTNISMNV